MSGEAEDPANQLLGLKLFVAEDEPLIALDLKLTLEDAGAEVVATARNLEEAISLSDRDYSLALLDVNLAGEMIFPAAERLSQRGVPILFTTGYDVPGAVQESLRNAATLQKPIDPAALIRCVAQLARRGTASDAA